MSSRRLAALSAAAAAFAAPATASAAEQIAAVTGSNKVITFASDSPGNIDTVAPIKGLAAGDKVVGIDVRPATGQLYALGSTSRLYVLDPITGATRLVGNGPFAPALQGTSFGFDFNPVADRVRVVSNARQNLRLNPDTGNAQTDGALAYKPGDAGAGTAPVVDTAAYANSTPDATATTLLGLEGAKDALVRVDPPNTGTLNTVGALGLDLRENAGFDLTPANIGFATLKPGGTGRVKLHRVHATTGRATAAADQPEIGTKATADDVVGIATLGPVDDDRTRPAITVDTPTSANRRNLSNGRSFLARVACSESCRIRADLRIGTRLIARGTAERFTRAGSVRIRIRATDAGRALLRRTSARRAAIRYSARDRAGILTRGSKRRFTLR